MKSSTQELKSSSGSNLITKEDIKLYQKQGYLVIPNLLFEVEIEKLSSEALKILRGSRGKVEGIVECKRGESTFDTLSRYLCIHFPNKISKVIEEFVCHEKIVEVLQQIVSDNVKCMQTMLFVKGPGKPGQGWHQDEYFIPTRDKSLTGVWIAIEDATVDNGCLWIVPGSHQPSFIRKRIDYQGDEYGETDICDISPYTQEDAVPVEIKAGGVIFFNGYLLHSSLKNRTADNFRTALVNHYMSAESMLPWDCDGMIPLKEDMRDITMVAGKDPYADKGIEELTKPFLRPDLKHFRK